MSEDEEIEAEEIRTAIDRVFEALKRDWIKREEIDLSDPDVSLDYSFKRDGDKVTFQSGYGPMDERSAVEVNMRLIVLAALGKAL